MVKARKSKVIAYIVLSILALLFVLPVAWVLLASFDTNASQAIAWPTNWTVENYVNAITSPDNLRAFGNGLILALGQSALVVVCAGLAAYPLSRYEMRHKQLFMLTMLFMTSLPANRSDYPGLQDVCDAAPTRQFVWDHPVFFGLVNAVCNLDDEKLYGLCTGRY